MVYEHLRLDVSENIATVILDRPKVMNALNRGLFNDLEAVFLEISGNAEVRAVILTGAGDKAFAAGADINELSTVDANQGQALSAAARPSST